MRGNLAPRPHRSQPLPAPPQITGHCRRSAAADRRPPHQPARSGAEQAVSGKDGSGGVTATATATPARGDATGGAARGAVRATATERRSPEEENLLVEVLVRRDDALLARLS